MKRFWCGWDAPNEIPEEHMVESWPAGVIRGWRSGYGEDYEVWVGLVQCETAVEAEALIRGCYGESAKKITMRWEPMEKPIDFVPGDRFPMTEEQQRAALAKISALTDEKGGA